MLNGVAIGRVQTPSNFKECNVRGGVDGFPGCSSYLSFSRFFSILFSVLVIVSSALALDLSRGNSPVRILMGRKGVGLP